jgi:hypothetical protein
MFTLLFQAIRTESDFFCHLFNLEDCLTIGKN